MTTTVVGQPCRAVVTFVDPDGNVVAPARVTLTLFGPAFVGTPQVVGEDEDAIALPGPAYALDFTPTSGGRWYVTGQAFSAEGQSVGAAQAYVDVAEVPLLPDPSDAARLALGIVEGFLHRPLRLITGARATLYTGEDGAVELPLRPVRAITALTLAAETGLTTSLLGDPRVFARGARIAGLPRFAWVDAVYNHGWVVGEVPGAITSVLAAVTARLAENPSGVVSERIDTYRVEYPPLGLTDDEKTALRPFVCGPSMVAGTLNTGAHRPPYPALPAWSEH